ncbi:MAG: hypothetical protein ACXVAM_04045 [Vulcanimicrobiaceae bacterium]
MQRRRAPQLLVALMAEQLCILNSRPLAATNGSKQRPHRVENNGPDSEEQSEAQMYIKWQ